MTLPVLTHPNPLLRRVSREIDLTRLQDPTLGVFLNDLKITMRQEDGVGLAAPQVGVDERIIVIDREGVPTAYINPVITERSFKVVEGEEGCLSVPDLWGLVKRHRSVTVTYFTEDGQQHTEKVAGLLAVIFQHEIDHLDGILFIDRATKTFPKK